MLKFANERIVVFCFVERGWSIIAKLLLSEINLYEKAFLT